MSAATVVRATDRLRREGAMPEPALDRVLSRAWRDLSAHRSADCPMCGEAMIPRYGVHARPIGGRCASCGTELS